MPRKAVNKAGFAPTPKLLAFIDEYMKDFNILQSENRLKLPRGAGTKMLNRPGVKEELERRVAIVGTAAAISKTTIIQELQDLILFDPRRFYIVDEKTGRSRLKHMHELDEFEARASVHFDIYPAGEGGPIRAKSVAKMKSIELLGKYFGMFTEKVEKVAPPQVNVNIDYGTPDRSTTAQKKKPVDDENE